MKPEFTPGPWEAHQYGEAVFAKGRRICVTATQGTSADKEARANAKLIAAAPDMLLTLEITHKHLSFLRDSMEGEERKELDESLDLILNTIKKATQ